MSDRHTYDFYAAVRIILERVAATEAGGIRDQQSERVRRDTLRYQRQLDMLQAELKHLLQEIEQPGSPMPARESLPPKRLACHHADSADATRLIEGDLPPWMIDCSEPH